MSGDVVGATKYRKDTGFSGKGVVVAVIDTEVDRCHPAFENRVLNKRNFSGEDWGNPQPHGTNVAGIIAARDARYSGMAPETTIYSYKLFPVHSSKPEDFHGACAIQQALEDGARIANCSWGSTAKTDGTSREVRACNRAWACGMTIVKSVGNVSPASPLVTCPADARGVIVVGATDRRGTVVLPDSCRGPTLNGKICPDLVAPGGDTSDDITTCVPGGGFDTTKRGLTSLAAAHVSGVLALLLEAEPDLTPDEQREQLLCLCEELPKGDENVQGKGLVSLANLPSCPQAPASVDCRAEKPCPAPPAGPRTRLASVPADSG